MVEPSSRIWNGRSGRRRLDRRAAPTYSYRVNTVSDALPRAAVRRPARRAQSLRTALSLALLAGLAVGCEIIPGVAIVGLTAFMIGALAFLVRLRRQTDPFDAFEVVIPVGVLYITYFGGGALYLTYSSHQLISMSLRPYILPAMALATVGFVALLCGYYLIGTRTRPSTLGRITVVHPIVSILAGTLGAVGIAAGPAQKRFVLSAGAISPGISAVQQLSVFFFFGWFLVWYEWAAGRTRGPARIGAFALMVVETAAVAYLTVGTKYLAIMICIIPCMAFYEAKRRLPLKSMAVVALVTVFVVFPFFNTFRFQAMHSDTNVRLEQTWARATRWDSDTYLDASVYAFLTRMTVISSVAAILADTGTAVPYAKGDTLLLAPISVLIPRFVWPEKPVISVGRTFAEKFRMVHAMDTETEIAVSLVGEFYWNFGIPCVVVGMLLIGAAQRWYYERYGRGVGYEPVRKAIYAALLLSALGLESNFAMVVGGFTKGLLLLLAFLVVMRRLGWCTTARLDAAVS